MQNYFCNANIRHIKNLILEWKIEDYQVFFFSFEPMITYDDENDRIFHKFNKFSSTIDVSVGREEVLYELQTK